MLPNTQLTSDVDNVQLRSLLVICTLQSHCSARKHAQWLRMSRNQRASTMGTQLPYFSVCSLNSSKSKLGSKSSLISLPKVDLAAATSDKWKNPSFEFWGVKSYTLMGTLDGATTENELGANERRSRERPLCVNQFFATPTNAWRQQVLGEKFCFILKSYFFG